MTRLDVARRAAVRWPDADVMLSTPEERETGCIIIVNVWNDEDTPICVAQGVGATWSEAWAKATA